MVELLITIARSGEFFIYKAVLLFLAPLQGLPVIS